MRSERRQNPTSRLTRGGIFERQASSTGLHWIIPLIAIMTMTVRATLCVAFLVLISPPSFAQQFPQTERQKAEEDRDRAQAARKKANQQMIDEDYKSLIEQTPSSNKKVDPWGNLRVPSSGK
jgi:hypothetical protein